VATVAVVSTEDATAALTVPMSRNARKWVCWTEAAPVVLCWRWYNVMYRGGAVGMGGMQRVCCWLLASGIVWLVVITMSIGYGPRVIANSSACIARVLIVATV
jgi:hypothetical protein